MSFNILQKQDHSKMFVPLYSSTKQNINLKQIKDCKSKDSENQQRSDKEIWDFIEHGFFLEDMKDKLETRMVDAGYTKPEMLEDPDPEIEDDDNLE